LAGVKTTVGEWRAFLDADWGHPDAWCDDEVFIVDGKEIYDFEAVGALAPETAISINYGRIKYPHESGKEDIDLVPFFRKWKKAQSVSRVLVEVDNSKIGALKTAVADLGGKVIQ
jgi:hypothetical protein